MSVSKCLFKRSHFETFGHRKKELKQQKNKKTNKKSYIFQKKMYVYSKKTPCGARQGGEVTVTESFRKTHTLLVLVISGCLVDNKKTLGSKCYL